MCYRLLDDVSVDVSEIIEGDCKSFRVETIDDSLISTAEKYASLSHSIELVISVVGIMAMFAVSCCNIDVVDDWRVSVRSSPFVRFMESVGNIGAWIFARFKMAVQE
jgi:hypothetical protein